MGSGISSQLDMFAMCESQISLENRPLKDVHAILSTLDHPILVRFLKIYGCHTLRIERRKLNGPSLLLLDDKDLGYLGLTSSVLEAVRGVRKMLADEAAALAAEAKARLEAEAAAKESEAAAIEHELAKIREMAGPATIRTDRHLTVEERRHKDYAKMRKNILQRSQVSLETHLLEAKLQAMMLHPDVPFESFTSAALKEPAVAVKETLPQSPGAPPLPTATEGDSAAAAAAAADGPLPPAVPTEAEVAATAWCEKQRVEVVQPLRSKLKERLIDTSESMQLSLSRNGEQAGLMVRGRLLRQLGKSALPSEVRLAKRHAEKHGEYWSSSDEEELEVDWPTMLNAGQPELKAELEDYYALVRDPKFRTAPARRPRDGNGFKLRGGGGGNKSFKDKEGRDVDAGEENNAGADSSPQSSSAATTARSPTTGRSSARTARTARTARGGVDGAAEDEKKRRKAQKKKEKKRREERKAWEGFEKRAREGEATPLGKQALGRPQALAAPPSLSSPRQGADDIEAVSTGGSADDNKGGLVRLSPGAMESVDSGDAAVLAVNYLDNRVIREGSKRLPPRTQKIGGNGRVENSRKQLYMRHKALQSGYEEKRLTREQKQVDVDA